MKAHTGKFKDEIKMFGRQLNSIISYTIDGVDYELGVEELNSITPHFESAILKSAMRGLEIDSNVELPKNTIINYKFGVKVRESTENDDGYDYVDFGNYIVKDVEKQEDTNSYKINAYDYMLKSMVDYEAIGITYPITIRDYINAICEHLGLVFKNANDTFANYNRQIPNELYLDSDGKSLGYTFRDVFDELSQVTASTICIDLETNQVEIRYIKDAMGKNKLNRNTEILNAYINATGGIASGNKFAYSDLIPVKQTNYIFSGRCEKIDGSSTAFYNKRIHGYDENGNWIKQINYERVEINHDFSILVTINDSRIKYVRLSYVMNDTSLQFEEGNQQSAYEEFGLEKINEEYLKDTNVNFSEKFGPVNTIVLSRATESDNVYKSYPENLPDDEKIEIKIKDNQIMNFNDRADYLPDILNQLKGLEYSIHDFASTGICYFDICDRYGIQIGENTYSCVMFNDEVEVTQGLEENIYTDMPENTKTDYTKADKDDRKINQIYLIVDKQNGVIQSLVDNSLNVSDSKSGVGSITLENAYKGQLYQLSIKGQISLLFPQSEEGLYGYPLVPSDELVPSDDLTPSSPVPYQNAILYPSDQLFTKSSNLLVDDTKYKLDFDFLNYIDNDVCDEFVYDNGICYIIRRVGIDENGDKYALNKEVIEARKSVIINVDSNSTISLESFNNAILKATYLLDNAYTDNFTTKIEVQSEIQQTAESITSNVTANYATKKNLQDVDATLSSQIQQTATSIMSTVSENYSTKDELNETEESLSSTIQQTAESITSTVSQTYETKTDAQTEYSQIQQTTDSISQTVANNNTKANIVAKINDNTSQVQIDADVINLSATDILNLLAGNSINLTSKNITLNSTNFNVDTNGNASFSNANRNNTRLKVSGTGFAGYNNTTNYYADGIGVRSSANSEIFSIRVGRLYASGVNYESPSINMTNGYGQTTDLAPADLSMTQGSSYTYVDAVSGVTHSSREEYKKNIVKRTNNLDLIKNVDVYEYLFKHEEENNKKHIGLIIGENYNTPKEIINESETGINLHDMCGVMWGAIKELAEENEKLKKEMEELKNAKN